MTEAEIFLADRGINPKEVIDGLYGAKIPLTTIIEAYKNQELKSKVEELNKTFPRYEDMPLSIQNAENYKKVVEFWHKQTIEQPLKLLEQ